jgi:hypothetical protein
MKTAIKLIVQSGQYEEAGQIITVNTTTDFGFRRRIAQLSREHAVYGDNWAGWINAKVAIYKPNVKEFDNQIIGGQNYDADWICLCDDCGNWCELCETRNTLGNITIKKAISINKGI